MSLVLVYFSFLAIFASVLKWFSTSLHSSSAKRIVTFFLLLFSVIRAYPKSLPPWWYLIKPLAFLSAWKDVEQDILTGLQGHLVSCTITESEFWVMIFIVVIF